jgi:hypothetical protein
MEQSSKLIGHYFKYYLDYLVLIKTVFEFSSQPTLAPKDSTKNRAGTNVLSSRIKGSESSIVFTPFTYATLLPTVSLITDCPFVAVAVIVCRR